MKKTYVLLVLLSLAAAPLAHAQSTFGAAWSLGIPTGDTSDFASGFSARGVSLDWRNFRNRDTAIGASIGWNVFNEEFSGTRDFGNVAVTGKSWNYVNAIPIYVNAFKYFGEDRRARRFFAGLNAGTIWLERHTEFGLSVLQEQNWHLAVAPEVGVQLPWSSFLGYLAVRYNVGFSAGDVDTQSWIDIRLGFGLD
jgi:hypothetical protein